MARLYLLRVGRYEFFKKKRPEFFSFASPSFRAWYLDDPSLNRTRSGPLEIRHPKLSVHIKFLENGAWKGLQRVTWRLGQKSKKYKKGWWCVLGVFVIRCPHDVRRVKTKTQLQAWNMAPRLSVKCERPILLKV